ncbi:hypothetical protein [Actinomadura rugatobispora]|uniref:Uncharacterized protein n=1 Tax=Actinomadura rugatobispora TaxID=1994 RepID=A0ABW1A2E8_9ACTN
MPHTYRALASELVRLRALTSERAEAGLAKVAEWGDLDEEAELPDLFEALREFGLTIHVPDKVNTLLDGYTWLIEEAVACAGGSMIIDDIELFEDEDDEDEDDLLHFRRDGHSIWWSLEHQSARYLDLMTVWENLHDLAPGGSDPRGYFQIMEEGQGSVGYYLLITPEQARALRDGLGLPLDEHGIFGPPGNPPTAEPGTLDYYMQDDRRYMDDESCAFLDAWLADMDAELDRWRARHLPADFPFDFTPASLSALKALLLAGPDLPDDFADGAVRYIGETAVRTWPCRWAYRHSRGDNPYTGVPLIRSNTPGDLMSVVVPRDIIEALLSGRDPGRLNEDLEEIPDAVSRYERAVSLKNG